MIEIAVRARELASSNLSSLIDKASNPAKMLRLLMTELEESVIALTRDAAALERAAGSYVLEGERSEAAAETWEAKAKLALAHDRDDLAKGALAERNAARASAEAQREAARAAKDEAATLRASVVELEAKHGETRVRLLKVLSETTPARGAPAQAIKSRGKSGALMDRLASLEKRIDFAAGKTQTLDHELAALAGEAAIEAELAALRKKAGKKK